MNQAKTAVFALTVISALWVLIIEVRLSHYRKLDDVITTKLLHYDDAHPEQKLYEILHGEDSQEKAASSDTDNFEVDERRSPAKKRQLFPQEHQGQDHSSTTVAWGSPETYTQLLESEDESVSQGKSTVALLPSAVPRQALVNLSRSDTEGNKRRSANEGQKGQKTGNVTLPTTGFVTLRLLGRLGNVMFQFASLYCIAKQTGMRVVLQPDPQSVGLFKDPTLGGQILINGTLSHTLRQSPEVVRRLGYVCCSFEKRLTQMEPSKNYFIEAYLQSWKYFETCKDDVEKLFTFKDKYIQQATVRLKGLRRRFPSRILIGVHIRMEDHLDQKAVLAGKRVAQPDYFVRAMRYFREKVGREVIFVVILSQQSWKWWMENVTSATDVMLLERSAEPAVDMELLSGMDHLIMSVGTFGWWAAYRNRGTVVYCKDFFTPGTKYASGFRANGTEFFYPGWIGL